MYCFGVTDLGLGLGCMVRAFVGGRLTRGVSRIYCFVDTGVLSPGSAPIVSSRGNRFEFEVEVPWLRPGC